MVFNLTNDTQEHVNIAFLYFVFLIIITHLLPSQISTTTFALFVDDCNCIYIKWHTDHSPTDKKNMASGAGTDDGEGGWGLLLRQHYNSDWTKCRQVERGAPAVDLGVLPVLIASHQVDHEHPEVWLCSLNRSEVISMEPTIRSPPATIPKSSSLPRPAPPIKQASNMNSRRSTHQRRSRRWH